MRFLFVGLAVLGSDDDTDLPSDLMDMYQKNVALHLASSNVDSLPFKPSQFSSPAAKKAWEMRRYRERLRKDPIRYRHYLDKQNEYARRHQEKIKNSGELDS
jgi:hypothetical protein